MIVLEKTLNNIFTALTHLNFFSIVIFIIIQINKYTILNINIFLFKINK